MTAAARSGIRRQGVTATRGDPGAGAGDQLAGRRARRSDPDIRAMAARDRASTAAYRAGEAGEPLSIEADDTARAAWEAGNSDRIAAQAAATASNGTAGATRAAPAAGGVTGRLAARSPLPLAAEPGAFLLGVIAYTVALQFVQGGVSQVRGWFAAKFLNRPWGGAGGGNVGPAGSAPEAPSGLASTTPLTKLVGPQ